MRRRYRQRDALLVDHERVIAGFVDRREQRLLAFGRRKAAVDDRAAFELDPVVTAGFDRRGRQCDAALDLGGHQRREFAAGQLGVQRGGALTDLRCVRARQAHSFEQHGKRALGHVLGLVVRVLPLHLEAGASSKGHDRIGLTAGGAHALCSC